MLYYGTTAAPRPTRRPARSWVSTTTTTTVRLAAGGITTLFVCWLHPGASEAEVQEVLERYGKVKEVHVDSAGMIGRSPFREVPRRPRWARAGSTTTPWIMRTLLLGGGTLLK